MAYQKLPLLPIYLMVFALHDGDNIEGVKCPICKERLTGNDTNELNMSLKEHMADVHQMRRIAPSEKGGTYTSPSYPPESRAEREVTTFSGRERYEASPEARRREEETTQWRYQHSGEEAPVRRETEEVTQWKYPRSGEGSERSMTGEARHGGGWTHRMWHRYDEMTLSTRCPLCDTTIRGSDDEDLSDELRFHFKDAHRDVMSR